MVLPALVMIGITWDSAATPRLAIVMLVIAIVCFSLAFFSFYAAVNGRIAAISAIASTES